MSDGKWKVELRGDQMDCVIECLSWIARRHELRTKNKDVVGLDEFAHAQAKARVEDTLAVFTQVGHR